MFCSNCGSRLPESAKFCPGCGSRQQTLAGWSAPATEPAPHPPANVRPQPRSLEEQLTLAARSGPITKELVESASTLWVEKRDSHSLAQIDPHLADILHDFHLAKVLHTYLLWYFSALDQDAGKRDKVGRNRVQQALNSWMGPHAHGVIQLLPFEECRIGIRCGLHSGPSAPYCKTLNLHLEALVASEIVKAVASTSFKLHEDQAKSFISILYEMFDDPSQVDRIMKPLLG